MLRSLSVMLVVASAAFAHPLVPGYERFHSGPDTKPSVGGSLLLSELNCTSCHASDQVVTKQAPVLDAIGARAKVGHLRKFIADPHAVKPGTTMPGLFAGDPDRDAKVEAIVHYLAGTGTTRQVRPDLKAILRGRDTYAKVGCVACHGGRDMAGLPAKPAFGYAVPLGDLLGKYTIPSLAAFLGDPLKTRPSGRMPHLLKAAEASDVAHYLLQASRVAMPVGRGAAKYSVYEGDWNDLPDFGKLKPTSSGTGPAFEVGLAAKENNFGLRFEGVFVAAAAGEYTFHLASDDGSRLAIDGKRIVDNDGIHATISKSGKVELTKGVHRIAVDFFQGGGEQVLEVEIEGRGLGRQPLGPHVAATEDDLDKKPDPKPEIKDEDTLVVDAGLAAKGKALFASVGCVNCHAMKSEGKDIAPVARTPLAKLKEGGCLAEKPAAGLPAYSLNETQRKSLAAAIAKPEPAATDAKGRIVGTMMSLNCYACHARDKIGGPTDTTSPAFQTTTPEMGDEGRLPPPLDGVGAKLNADYVRQLLDKGADDRPYMHTRMPGFGAANAGHLVAAFESLDSLTTVPSVKFADPPNKVVAVGRQMTGAQGFGCVKCHTFAGVKAEGVQGIDMLLMPKRLKRDWFHAYCVDPQKIRPGTRMPTAWPAGQSTLPKLLDGTAAGQIEAIWLYLTSKNPAIPPGMGAKFIPLVPTEEAIVYRNFIQGAGPRGIAVGYPEKVNLAFDANELRLAMVWKNGFIDAAKHWTDRGVGFEGPLGDDVVLLPNGPNFAVLPNLDAQWPTGSQKDAGQKFLGYTLTKDQRPTFRYSVGGMMVEDFPNPVAGGLRRTLTLSADKADGLYFRAGSAAKIDALPDGWFQVGDVRISLEGGEAKVRKIGGRTDLLVPIKLKDGKAKLIQELKW